MGRKELVTSLVLMAVACLALLEAVQLPFGTPRVPQSGFWPTILAILLAFFSLIQFGKTIGKKARGATPFWAETSGWQRILWVVGSLVAFAFLFEPLGYLLSVFLMIGFLLWIIEPRKWWRLILVALLISVLSYLMFGILLKTPLPSGILNL